MSGNTFKKRDHIAQKQERKLLGQCSDVKLFPQHESRAALWEGIFCEEKDGTNGVWICGDLLQQIQIPQCI